MDGEHRVPAKYLIVDEIGDHYNNGTFRGNTLHKCKSAWEYDMFNSGNRATINLDAILVNTADMVAAMHGKSLFQWTTAFFYQYIHACNPRLLPYLAEQLGKFNRWDEEVAHNGRKLRNDLRVRRMFTEMMIVFAFSPKCHMQNTYLHVCPSRDLSIHSLNAFRLAQQHERYVDVLFSKVGMEAPEKHYYRIFLIPLNELIVSIVKDVPQFTFRWLQYMLDIHYFTVMHQDPVARKRLLEQTLEDTLACVRYLCDRSGVFVSSEKVKKNHVVWVLWATLFWLESCVLHDPGRWVVLTSAFQLFVYQLPAVTKNQLEVYRMFCFLFSTFFRTFAPVCLTPNYDQPMCEPSVRELSRAICETSDGQTLHAPYRHVNEFRVAQQAHYAYVSSS